MSVAREAREAWDRRDGESAGAYAAFRRFRDLGPLRRLDDVSGPPSGVRTWSAKWDWLARAVAWDDTIHQAADAARVEAIRTMHADHLRAGRAAVDKAVAALAALDPDEIPAHAAARLLELGTKLERDTLTVSVEELQGRTPHSEGPDPWDVIARELAGDRPD